MSFARNILYSSLLYILLPECQLFFEIAILFLVLCYIYDCITDLMQILSDLDRCELVTQNTFLGEVTAK